MLLSDCCDSEVTLFGGDTYICDGCEEICEVYKEDEKGDVFPQDEIDSDNDLYDEFEETFFEDDILDIDYYNDLGGTGHGDDSCSDADQGI